MLRTGGLDGVPPGRLMQAADGTFYGNSGGDLGVETFYKMTALAITEIHRYWSPGGFKPAPRYDGDGRADVAVYRELTGEWFIHRSIDGGVTQLGWGSPALGDSVREY